MTDTSVDGGGWVTATIERLRYRTVVRARDHVVELDEPAPLGGGDTGATPYEALLGALGACTAMTVRMYADRKAWPLERVRVRLRTGSSHEQDCEACEEEEVGPHVLERVVELEGALSEEQRARLLEIADRCPVKQVLERRVAVRGAGDTHRA